MVSGWLIALLVGFRSTTSLGVPSGQFWPSDPFYQRPLERLMGVVARRTAMP